MDFTQIFFYISEIIGTVAFSVSGAMMAIDRKLDLFGVVFLGVTTAIGGGITRDILIGRFPPAMFCSYKYLVCACIASLLVFVVAMAFKEKYATKVELIDRINNIFDAMGLGVFTVIGAQTAVNLGYVDNPFLCIFSGMVTAIGGGLLRDILSREMPLVLRKHIYALASLCGAILYIILIEYKINNTLSMFLGFLNVFLIRMLATHFRWKLPKAL